MLKIFLSSKNPNIKFTMEKQTNKLLQFLDVLFKDERRTFDTSVEEKVYRTFYIRQYFYTF